MSPTNLQQLVKSALEADATLQAARCGVSCQDDADIAAKIEEALGVGGGVHALVSTPGFTPRSTAAKNAVGMIKFKVAVTEAPAINRETPGYVTAADLAWHVAYLLNQYSLGPGNPMLVLDGEISPAASADGSTVVYSIPFSAQNQLVD